MAHVTVPARPLVCIGHSHLRSLDEAAATDGVPLVALNFWSLKDATVTRDGRITLCDPVTQHLDGGPVFSWIGGSAHHTLGLLQHPRPFDFVLPSAPDLPLDPRAEVLPFDCVRAALLESMRDVLRLMRLLREATTGPVFHLEPPPIYSDESRLAADIHPILIFRLGIARSRRDLPGTRVGWRHLRFKLWQLHSEVIDEFCRSLDIGFVRHPPEAADAEGYLRPEYYLNPMHVNSDYGRLVMHQMQQLV